MDILKLIPSYDDVRAVLGVDDEELTDEQLALAVYSLQLSQGIDDVYENLPDLYKTLMEKKEQDPESLTRLEKKILGTTQVYATYLLGSIIAPTLPIFAPKKISDGKALTERISDPYKNIKAQLDAQLGDLLGTLEDLLGEYGENIPTKVFTFPVRGVGLAVDPITGGVA